MDEGERGHSAPPATHWNVERNPIESFCCPRCGHRVQLKPLTNTSAAFPELLATCATCGTAINALFWQLEKIRKRNEEW